jgi:hypothetical protein
VFENFRSQTEQHQLSHLYEAKIRNMQRRTHWRRNHYYGACGSVGETAFLFLQHFILPEFGKLQKTFADSPKSWTVDTKTIDRLPSTLP